MAQAENTFYVMEQRLIQVKKIVLIPALNPKSLQILMVSPLDMTHVLLTSLLYLNTKVNMTI